MRHEQTGTDILHVEKCETLRDGPVLEGPGVIITASDAQCQWLKVSVVKNRFPSISAVVAPLYTAPFGEPLSELSTSKTALMEGAWLAAEMLTAGFQPEMVPLR